jgi:hypothetical protein
VNLFQRVERLLQRTVERPFTRLARSRLQPVEVARALGKELVANRRVGIGRVYAPNWFHAELSTADFRQFEPFLVQLEQEIAQDLQRQAQRRRYAFVGDITVELLANADLRSGDILATAEIRESAPIGQGGVTLDAPVPRTSVMPAVGAPLRPAATDEETTTLLIRDERGAERRVQLAQTAVRIGRGLDNDIVVDSLSVSREHARLVRDGGIFVEDLASRNGTFVNGQRVQRARVGVGDRIRLGAIELRIEP